MEHVAQAVSILLLFFFATKILVVDPATPIGLRDVSAVLASASFAGAIRYEAVLAVMPVVVLLLVRRRMVAALLLPLFAALGPAAFAAYSYVHSGFFLPFSVMVKIGQGPGPIQHLRLAIGLLLGRRWDTPFAGTLILLWWMRLRRAAFWMPVNVFALLTIALTVGHMLLAPVGWMMRYEGYLVCLTFVAMSLILGTMEVRGAWTRLRASVGWRRVTAVLLVGSAALSAIILLVRIGRGLTEPVEAAVDRYNEHIQMARFVVQSYDTGTVVVDDIGAVAYYSHASLLDMVGLGSAEPLLPMRHGRKFTAEDMSAWADARGASIAILHENGVKIQAWTPSAWTLVQVWTQPRNVVFGDLQTSIFAVHPTDVLRLCQSFSTFPLTEADRVTFNACTASPGDVSPPQPATP